MRSAILPCIIVSLAALFAVAARSEDKPNPNVASTPHRTPEEERKLFRLPPGFEIQLVAAEPDIHKPLNLAFDDRGRLWVTDTLEYPFPPPAGKKSRDSVKILEDFAADGRARKITTFADDLVIPIGILPLPAAKPQDALVFSIPSIYRLRDSKGGEHADHREALYTEYGRRDTHGLTGSFTWGFDGWIYAVHGFSNDSTVKAKDGSSIHMNSGNTYRIRPDGSHIEFFTHGQVNPFGLSFDPLGNLYSADCHTQPIYQLLRGAWYPSFGKPHDGLGFGPEMYKGYTESTAVAGVAYYAADNYPPAWRDCAYIGDVVSHRVNQFAIEWHGSTPKGILKRFLESDDPWFRPSHVQLGPDGALYVADFYNRIIGHYEVPLTHPGRDRTSGRIWRIVYRGEKPGAQATGLGAPAPRADWTTAAIADLIKDIGHPNLTVRMHAMNQLIERGGKDGRKAVHDRLSEKANSWQWIHGLWVLERGGALEDELLTKAAKHKDRGVRVHVQRILSERAHVTAAQHDLALAGLKDSDAHVERAAADALGQHPARKNVEPLLALRRKVPADDTHLVHVLRMSLRNQLRDEATLADLAGKKWGQNEPEPHILAESALGVSTPSAAAFLMTHLAAYDERGNVLLNCVHHIARHGTAQIREKLIQFVRGHDRDNLGQQAALFHEVEHGLQESKTSLPNEARTWAVDLTGRLLASKHGPDVEAGIKLAGDLRLTDLQTRLAEVARRRDAPEGQRRAALDALAKIDTRQNASVLGGILGDAQASIALREQSAKLLAQANQPQTQAELLKILPAAPARLQTAIAVGLAASPAGAEKLLDAVKTGKASARLLQDPAVKPRLEATRLPRLKERLAELTAGLPPAGKEVQALLQRRRESFQRAKKDAALGAQVFTKSCANCHQVGGQGAKIGPQLDGVGVRGLDRLLEDVLDPNRNVDQAFRQTTLTLKKGQVQTGLLLREEGAVLVLADSQGKEVRVAKDEVEERAASQVSPMPGNFAEQIPESDFNNLLAYLLTLQSKQDKSEKNNPQKSTPVPQRKDGVRRENGKLGQALPTVDTPLPRPGMGWTTFNFFGARHGDKLMRQMGDAFAASGLRDAGYTILRIDGGWWGDDGNRRWWYWTEAGTYANGWEHRPGDPHVDPKNYPGGIRPLADYLHKKELKLGFYLAPEISTGAADNYPGNKDRKEPPPVKGLELVDQHARWVADNGIDHLFYDGYDWNEAKGTEPYTRMFSDLRHEARRVGRPIVFSINSGWKARPREWADEWRTGRDVDGHWQTLLECLGTVAEPKPAGKGRWNNPDCLMAGFCGDEEAKSQMSLWCVAGAPLYLSSDLRVLNDWDSYVVLNTEAIAVDQDAAATPGHRLRLDGAAQVWARPLADGSKAVVLLNAGDKPLTVKVRWEELGLPPGSVQVRDLWAHKNLGSVEREYVAKDLPPRKCVFLKVVAGDKPLPEPKETWAPHPGKRPNFKPLSTKGWTFCTDLPRKDDSLSNLADGDAKTGFWSWAEPGKRIDLDLGKPRTFDRIVLDHKGVGPNPWPYKVHAPRSTFTLEVSEDGKTFRKVAADSFGPAYTIITFKPVTARHVRVVLGEVERTSAYGDLVWGAKDIYLFDAGN